MAAQTFIPGAGRAAKLRGEAETLRKAGTLAALGSIVGMFATAMSFPSFAASIGVVASGAAAVLLYRKISAERAIAQLEGRLPQSVVRGDRPVSA